MRRKTVTAAVSILLPFAILVLSACGSTPPPRIVYEDSHTIIGLMEDPQAGGGHSHPTTLTVGQAAKLLLGIRVKNERYAVHRLLAGDAGARAVFKGDEAFTLAPHLVKALEAAKPNELVTFYRRVSDASTGLAYTTGGLFKRGDYMYIILANYRQEPADAMSMVVPAHEIDPIDDPLLPLRRAGYSVSFVPETAEVHPVAGQWQWRFPDARKVVIVELPLVLRNPETTP